MKQACLRTRRDIDAVAISGFAEHVVRQSAVAIIIGQGDCHRIGLGLEH